MEKTGMEILRKLCSRENIYEPVEPSCDRNSLIGFTYEELKETLRDSVYEETVILDKLEKSGYLKGVFRERVILCPSCSAYNIIFRDTCPLCGSPDLKTSQMVHHYRCGYVGIEKEFLSNNTLTCPKCFQKLKHIGKDFEKPAEIFICNECAWSGSETVTGGRCLSCNTKIQNDNYIVKDVKSYILTPKGVSSAKSGKVFFEPDFLGELRTKDKVKNNQWSLASLLGITNIIITTSERSDFKLTGVSIIPDNIYKAGEDYEADEEILDKEKLLLPGNNTVYTETCFALLNAIQEKIRIIVRECDFIAVTESLSIFILLPFISAEESSMLAKKILNEISHLTFSGRISKTTLSIGVSRWLKGDGAIELFERSNSAMREAVKKGGNQIMVS